MRKLCTGFYYFMCALAWIFGWHILLYLEIKERLQKRAAKGDKK